MDFEVLQEGDSLYVDGIFIPSAPSGTIPDGTVVKVYAQDGLHATSKVNATSGNFSIAITNIPPGGIPILFTFPSPLDAGNSKPLGRKLATAPALGAFASPCFAYVKNPNKCAPALSFTLTWNGPTSALNLYVFEPSGTGVSYNDDADHINYTNYRNNSLVGFFETSSSDGYGPQHYVVPNATSGQMFSAQVQALSMNVDAKVVWSLQARTNGELLWTKTGTFKFKNQNSGSFEVEIGKAGNQSCGNTSQPTYHTSWWCSFWNLTGNQECNNQAQIDLYIAISAITALEKPVKDELQLVVHLLFLPAVIKLYNQSAAIALYEQAINAITTSCDIRCTCRYILDAVRDFTNRELSFRALEFLIGAVKTVNTTTAFFYGSSYVDWETGYMKYIHSLSKFKDEKLAIFDEVNGAATRLAIEGLGAKLVTCGSGCTKRL